MPASSMRSRITIQRRDTGVDDWGQAVTTWSDVLSCWAAVRPLSGRELVAAQAMHAETTYEVEIRYPLGVAGGISPAMRVVYGSKVFEVLSVLDAGMRHVTLRLLCSEGLTRG